MRRFLSYLTLGLAVAAVSSCGSKTPTTPTPTPIPNPTFRATLLPSNEVPPVSNSETSVSGTMNITINATRDAAGTITAATVDFSGSVTGFPAGSAVTAAHIHPGAAGVNGGFIINLGLAAGEIPLTSGTGTITKTGISATVDQVNQIINNPAGFYFNVHSSLNGGGVARGQLVRTN
jgi:hypothetical protein